MKPTAKDSAKNNFRRPSEYIGQFIHTTIAHRKAADFIRNNRLWEGVLNYGWVSRLLIIASLIVGLKFLSIFVDWFKKVEVSNPISAMSTMGGLFQSMAIEGYQFFFFGGMKYVMLILLEVVVFHFCRRTLNILSGEDTEMGFDAFFKAQIRMIKVSLRSWIMETIISIMIGIVLSFVGFLEFLKPVLIFGVQCYYLGFAIVDNYTEQFELSINESAKFTRQYIGVALSAGLILTLIMYIPIAGPILGPILSAVAVTLVMYEISDLEIKKVAAPESDPEEIV